MVTCLKYVVFSFLLLLLFAITGSKINFVYADTLGSASDTLTTSRPSASTPLSADATSPVSSVSVSNNGSTFLASDSARLYGQTAETVTIATVSAAKTTLFFTGNTANSHANGTVIAAPVTSVHTIKFTTTTAIPTNGTIEITFPISAASDTNQASPSASTFMFNGLSTSNTKANFSSGSSTCTFTFSGNTNGSGSQTPKIICTVGSATVASGVTVTILVGCTTAGTSCAIANQSPALINPTKTAQGGTADAWSVKIATFNTSGGTQLDNTTLKIGTDESVNVVAHIDSTFTFIISGIANGLALNTVCTNGGNNPDTTDSGFPTTSTDVNLGTLLSSATSHAAQKMVVTSNAGAGYTITATSSGYLINPANGAFIANAQGTPTANDSPVPASIANGSNKFGIHPCELTAQNKLNTSTWGSSTPLYANPSPSFYYTLVNSATAPASSGDTFYVEYAASPASTTAPGDYRTQLTYVATVIF